MSINFNYLPTYIKEPYKIFKKQYITKIQITNRPGLVQRPVTVHPSDPKIKPFTRHQWVRPDIGIQVDYDLLNYDPRELELEDLELLKNLLDDNMYNMEKQIQEYHKNISIDIDIDALHKILKDFGKKLKDVLDEIENRRESKIPPLKSLEEYIPSNITEEEKFLIYGEIENSEILGGGVNQAILISFKDSNKFAIFKPHNTEKDFDIFNDIEDRLLTREVAAYQFAKILDFGHMVPRTMIREHQGQLGSVQEFIKDADKLKDTYELIDQMDKDKDYIPSSARQLYDAALFDILIGNGDRHIGNVLSKDEELILIDHGYSFPNQLSPSRFFSEFYDRVYPSKHLLPEHKDILNHLVSHENHIYSNLYQFLSEDEIDAVIQRAQVLLKYDSYNMNTWEI
ncbi:MAG: hypothetical protein ACE5H1_10220 [Thermodesulfobacteriota bacterium]